jgi:hypothetical protein
MSSELEVKGAVEVEVEVVEVRAEERRRGQRSRAERKQELRQVRCCLLAQV